MKTFKIFTVLYVATSLTACATNIHPKDGSITPPKVNFGQYQNYVMEPMKVEHSEGDDGDLAAAKRIEAELKTCMADALPHQPGKKRILITPIITDLKKVGSTERVFLGAMAGSSAVLLNVKYTDMQTRKVIADPTFYSKAAAMGGAWTFGSTDNAMLTRLVTSVCDYTKKYR